MPALSPIVGFPLNPVVGKKYKLLSYKINGVVQKVNKATPPQANVAPEFIPYTGNPDEGLDFVYNAKGEYWCDCNIVAGISWNTLNSAGFITGKNITIDGLGNINISSPKSQSAYGNQSNGPGTNDWDDNICNLTEMPGVPAAGDASSNDFWHWQNYYSWCQEAYSSYRVIRGNDGARYWSGSDPSYTYGIYGFRPVLKNLKSLNLQSLPDLGRFSGPFLHEMDTTPFWANATASTMTLHVEIDTGDAAWADKEGITPGTVSERVDVATWRKLAYGQHGLCVEMADTTSGVITCFSYGFVKAVSDMMALEGGMRIPVAGTVSFNRGDDDAATFALQFAKDTGFTSGLLEFPATQSPAAYSGLTLHDSYYARLKAVSGETTEYSPTVSIRVGDVLEFLSAKGEDCDSRPATCQPKVFGDIDPKARQTYWMTNNANDPDDQVVWEECTPKVNQGEHRFANTTKSAAKWAMRMKVKIEARNATGNISVDRVMF